jgi:hypothetical protein
MAFLDLLIFIAKEKYIAESLEVLRKITIFAHWKAPEIGSRFRKSPIMGNLENHLRTFQEGIIR